MIGIFTVTIGKNIIPQVQPTRIPKIHNDVQQIGISFLFVTKEMPGFKKIRMLLKNP